MTTTNNTTNMMNIQRKATAGVAHPFGDTRSVSQAFPMGIPSEESDPFLMCDFFDSEDMDDLAKHDDDFPIGWHPHRGFDIATYMKKGKGRHGDSLGNRETFTSPGLQWMSTGSGVYHAEGGANPKGERMQGFQLWINVPSDKKLDEPRYGTVQPKDLPIVKLSKHCNARVLAGDFGGVTGPFTTVQPVQMIDLELQSSPTTLSSTNDESEESSNDNDNVNDDDESAVVSFNVATELDTAILYVYEGTLQSLNNDDEEEFPTGSVIVLDASDKEKRHVVLKSLPGKSASVMLFAGKRLNQPIAWQGPIVMTDEYEIANTMSELRGGFFPPVCVDWDYRRLASKPVEDA